MSIEQEHQGLWVLVPTRPYQPRPHIQVPTRTPAFAPLIVVRLDCRAEQHAQVVAPPSTARCLGATLGAHHLAPHPLPLSCVCSEPHSALPGASPQGVHSDQGGPPCHEQVRLTSGLLNLHRADASWANFPQACQGRSNLRAGLGGSDVNAKTRRIALGGVTTTTTTTYFFGWHMRFHAEYAPPSKHAALA